METKEFYCSECNLLLGVLTEKGLMVGNIIIRPDEKSNEIEVNCSCGSGMMFCFKGTSAQRNQKIGEIKDDRD